MVQDAEEFLELLTDGGPCTFQTFDETQAKRSTLNKILHGNLHDHDEKLKMLNQRGAGIFVMVNAGDLKGRKAKNVERIRAVFVDLDGSPIEPVLEAPLPPHIVIESSPGHFHAYWRLESCPLERFSPLQAALATRFDSDPKVKDLCRVMRLPGYLHQKGDPFQTRILKVNSVLPYTFDDLVVRLGLNKQLILHAVCKQMLKGFNDSYKTTIVGFDQGNRNEGLFRYACNLRRRGIQKEEAQLLLFAAAKNCRPPLMENEVRKCLESAWGHDLQATERLTDVGNGQRIVRLHGADLRYNPESRKWLVWDDKRWCVDQDGAITRRAKDTAASLYDEAKYAAEAGTQEIAKKIASHASSSQSAARIRAMIELAQSEPSIPVRTIDLDQNNFLLGVPNGVIDLRTSILRESRREDLITKQASVAYHPNAEAPLFLKFLKRIFDDNQAIIDFLQRAIGYSLTGDTREQCLFFLYGTGANGKSTLLNIFKEILGDYSMQCPAETLMAKKSVSNVPNDIARLRGARFVATSEIEDGHRLAESMIKQVTGQDTITARFLFAEHFEFVPNFKIWLAANHKPIIRGDDHAIWRRIHLLAFTVTIPLEERDKNLALKLRDEYPGILAWAVQGGLKWQREGIKPPKEVLAATQEYKREMDLIGTWIEECCVIKDNATAKANALYQSYKRWVEDNGGIPLSGTMFGLKISEKGFSKEKKGTVSYDGIGLLEASG